MSIKLTQLVWNTELPLTSSERLVLFCLANFANDKNDLLCCPSYRTLEKKSGLSKRTVIRVIMKLCEDKILIKNHTNMLDGEFSSNEYFFNEEVLVGGVMVSGGWCHGVTTPSDMVSPNKDIFDNYINKKNIIKKRNLSLTNPEKSMDKEKVMSDAKELIDMFIRLTGKNYRYSPTLMRPIIARLKEGYTLQECKTVIARKYNQWKGKKDLEPYIRPTTIFRPTNFPEYLAECVTEEEKEKLRNDYSTKLDTK